MSSSMIKFGIARMTRFVPSLGTALRSAEVKPAMVGSAARCFHSSPYMALPPRRRRVGKRGMDKHVSSSEESYANPLKHVAVVESEVFRREADALLTKIERALQPMKEKNEIFVVTRRWEDLGPTLSIDLSPKDGSYIVEVNEEEHLLQFSSPISGSQLYILSQRTGEWVGAEDGHLFEGLLVRDLIRQCQGLPDL